MTVKLKAKLWVQAQLRASMAEGIAATVVRRGDPDAGSVLLKMNQGSAGCCVLTQVRDAEGRPAWLRGTGPDLVPEAAADAYIDRQTARDPDLWVVEIEDRQGRPPVSGTVIG